MNERPVRVVGTGAYLPGDPVKFSEIDDVLGELDEVGADFKKWYRRTAALMEQILGMENYYYAIDRETGESTDTCSGLSAKASRKAIEMANMVPEDIDLLIYAGASLDRFVCPPTSALVQEALGIKHCAETTIHSNCTATYKGLQFATDLIANGRYRTALVCSASQVSSALRAGFFNQAKLDRNQAILRWFLSDGGGAIVLKAEEEDVPGLYVRETYLESVGADYPPHMYNLMGASSLGPKEDYARGYHHLTQDFREVSQLGPHITVEGLMRFLEWCKQRFGEEEFQRRTADVTHVLANVPTRHMLDLTRDEIMPLLSSWNISPDVDLYYTTTDKLGYTGPTAILLTLDRLLRHERLKDRAILLSFVTESSKWMNAGFVMEWRG